MREVLLSIIKYDVEFTKRTKDLKRNVWFSFPNDLLLHPDFDDITGEELKWFIWCVSVCSKINNSEIRLNVDHACRKLNLKAKDFDSMCEKLQGKQIHIDTTAARPQHDRSTTATNITNNTLHNNTLHNITGTALDFEYAYSLYRQKKGKSAGMKKIQKEIKTEQDFNNFVKAIENYNRDLDLNKTDQKYIKHFSTFCGEWRDWVEYEPAGQKRSVFDIAKEQMEKIDRGEL